MVAEIYNFIDRVVLKYQLTGLLGNRRPYTYGEIKSILSQLKQKDPELTEIERKQLRNFTTYFLRSGALFSLKGVDHLFSLNLEPGLFFTCRTPPAVPSGTEYAWQLRPIAVGTVKDTFAFLTDLRFYLVTGTVLNNTIRKEVTMDQPREEFFDTAGLVPSYAKFKLPWFTVSIERDNLSWGPGRHGNLLISTHSLPMDMIRIQAQYNKLGFQAFTAIAKGAVGNKIISAHRLDFNLWDKVNLGIAEVITIADEDFEFRFLNPFTVYTISEPSGDGLSGEGEVAEASLGNLLISGDFELRTSSKLALYGELMVDDFQPRYGLRSHLNWASKFGIQIGAHFVDPLSFKNTQLRIEYTFVNQYAYTHVRPTNVYTHFNQIIGHKIGTDSDNLWIGLRCNLTDRLSAGIGYEMERHGEQDVNIPHATTAPVDEEWEFLSGLAEKSHKFPINIRYNLLGNYLLEGTYIYEKIRNRNHIQGKNLSQKELSINALYRF